MTRRLVLLVGVFIASGCCPAPRSADYFIAHQEEAARVVEACRRGDHRGEECKTAHAGVAAAASAKRKELYRQSFQGAF